MSSGWTHRIDVPGRVNLIGEHIDYVGLSVLPMAIDRRITLYIRPRADGRVHLANVVEGRGDRAVDLGDLRPEFPPADWGNYLRAAALGLVEAGLPVSGFDGRLDSDLPPAAGLSSSSALVVASALGLLTAARTELPPALELASLLATAEGHTGTRGGGMDQAAILSGQAGAAVRIDFDPLASTVIPVPSHWSFIVAHSMVEAEKSGADQATYNARRESVEEAVGLVAAHLDPAGETTPASVLKRWPATELLSAARRLPQPLLGRLRHVVTEAARVSSAERCLTGDDPSGFGELMFASHESLARDFEVSTSDLDDLVRDARQAGALGARLTGAGLGGCAVVLALSSRVSEVMDRLRDTYYARRGIAPTTEHLFVARPSGGALVTAIAGAPAGTPSH